MTAHALTIFVPHASDVFTDHEAHGDGLVAFEIASRLARRGHTVHVAAPRIAIAGAAPPSLVLHELASSDPGSLRARAEYMLRVRLLFAQVRRAERIDLVHQLNPVFTGISAALPAGRVPVVLGSFVADWPGDGVQPGRFGALAKRWAATVQQRRADTLLVTTPAARGRIVERRASAKIAMLPHGIDPARYAAVVERRPPPGSARILYLGGIEERKGIFTLLEAFARVAVAIPAATLVVAGSGFRWTRFIETARASPAAAQIVALGAVARDEVPRLMAECNVFCMPSHGEPFGMALLEAMACGRAAVVTDAGGPAYIADDRGACKVPPHDAESLAAALIAVLRSEERQHAMGRFNRALVERVYRWDAVIDRLEAVYRDVVGRHATAHA